MLHNKYLILPILAVAAIAVTAGYTGTSGTPGAAPTAAINVYANNTMPNGGMPPAGAINSTMYDKMPGEMPGNGTYDMPLNGTMPNGTRPGRMPPNATAPGGTAPLDGFGPSQ